MKVLLVAPGLLPIPPIGGGGVEWYIYRLAGGLSEDGAEVALVSDKGPGFRLPSVKVYPTASIPLSNVGSRFISQAVFACYDEWRVFRSAVRAIEAEDPDIVHVHDVRGNLPGLLLSFMNLPAPLVLTVHGPVPWTVRYSTLFEQAVRSVAYRLLDVRLLKRVDWIIAVQETLAEEVVRLGVASDRVVTIHNGVDLKHFQDDDGIAGGKQERYILALAQLVPRKGLDILIRAMRHVREDLALFVAGHGPELARLSRLAETLGLGERVRFLGAVQYDELPSLYRNAEVFVLPSRAEASPQAITEALAAGLPCVASDLPGTRTMIRDGQNGYLVPPGDAAALGNCLRRLLEAPDKLVSMRMGLKSSAIGDRSWKHVAEEHLGVYRAALNARGKPARRSGGYLGVES